jgi:hypothetical protein
MSALQPQCGDGFGCTLAGTVITWLIFAVVLSATGYLVIIPLSMGNNPTEWSPIRNALAFIFSLIITWIPYVAVETCKQGIELPYEGPESTVTEPKFNGAQWTTRAIGAISSLLILIQFFLGVIDIRRLRASKLLSYLSTTSHVRGTACSKKAATRKINAVMENAHKLMPKSASKHNGPPIKEETMINFVIRGESFEDCGGLAWTWMRLLSGALFEEDGIWITSRLIIIQTVQLFLFAFVTYTGVLLVNEAMKRAEQAQAILQPGYPQWVYEIVPTPNQVKIALYPALGIVMFVMITLFLVYIPRYVFDVLELTMVSMWLMIS